MSEAKKFALLLEIAERALDADDCARARRIEARRLTDAYEGWKAHNGVSRIERETTDWDCMMAETAREFGNLEATKRLERNARKRLASAVRRYRSA